MKRVKLFNIPDVRFTCLMKTSSKIVETHNKLRILLHLTKLRILHSENMAGTCDSTQQFQK